MAGRDGKGESFSPGSRKQDRTIDDALRTMERLATWIELAKRENVWQQADNALQVGMLHGMLVHLRREIDQLIDLGGAELTETVQALRTLVAQEE
jgi:hypothetical protein